MQCLHPGLSVPNIFAHSSIGRLDNNNAQNEYYVTDLVPLANAARLKVTYALAPEDDMMGVNSRQQLAASRGPLPKARCAMPQWQPA